MPTASPLKEVCCTMYLRRMWVLMQALYDSLRDFLFYPLRNSLGCLGGGREVILFGNNLFRNLKGFLRCSENNIGWSVHDSRNKIFILLQFVLCVANIQPISIVARQKLDLLRGYRLV